MSVLIWNFDVDRLFDRFESTENLAHLLLLGIRMDEKNIIFGGVLIEDFSLQEYQRIYSMLPYGYSIMGCANPNDSLLQLLHAHLSYPFVIATKDPFTDAICIHLSDNSEFKTQSKESIQAQLSSLQWIHIQYPLDITYTPSDDFVSVAQTKIETMDIRLIGSVLIDSTKQQPIASLQSVQTIKQILPNVPSWMNPIISLKGVSLLNSSLNPPSITSLDTHYKQLPFSFLLCIPKTDPISILPEIVRIMMVRQLPFVSFSGKHFCVADHLPITLYHKGSSFPFVDSYDHLKEVWKQWRQDEEECQWREKMAKQFGLRPNCPHFRNTNALFYAIPRDQYLKMTGEEGIIADLHTHLLGHSVDTSDLIEGHYLYYHYNQQRFHDKGWGCAYRSLQTLCSFFVMNHYYSMRIPTIPDIQQLLISIGDKPGSFLGSKEWIGSQEVGYVLNTLFNVDCKYILLDKGRDIVNHLDRLSAHFQYQKTPVMIGGGVLAFTCLGMQWNRKTNECKLLILDPHFAGDDHLSEMIQNKQQMEGYKGFCCGWKALKEIFSDAHFYRLCLPQRPFVYSLVSNKHSLYSTQLNTITTRSNALLGCDRLQFHLLHLQPNALIAHLLITLPQPRKGFTTLTNIHIIHKRTLHQTL